MNKDFNHSYWELNSYFKPSDLTVIGAGIVGLSTAISYKLKNKKANVLVLDRGVFPEGASTKNAGFACFGSAGELLDDLKNTKDHHLVWETVRMRWEGLGLLKKRLGEKTLDYKHYGGYELFADKHEFNAVNDELINLNKNMLNVLGIKNCYQSVKSPLKMMNGFSGALHNVHEGQLDTGKMMLGLEAYARQLGIRLIYNITIDSLFDMNTKVELNSSIGLFETRKCVVATNGFAKHLLKLPELSPARAQVLITSPIAGLKIKGTYHFEKGYYYFRNIHKRLLFGGGRHLDFKKEETDKFGHNSFIQKELERLLKTQILPKTPYHIDQRWSGIMGIGIEKKPIVTHVSKNVVAAVRMGGMGVAIGSKVGELAADLAE